MKSKLYLLACFGLLAAMRPAVRADEWDQKTVLTFSAPVEIPGQVLPPGTYVFELADSSSDRNIVQVFNKNKITCTELSWPSRITEPKNPARR